MAGLAVDSVLPSVAFMDEKEAITVYFMCGHTYAVILLFLNIYHGLKISMRTLKRRLLEYRLSRRTRPTKIAEVWNAIHNELQGPNRCGGYRTIWRTLRFKYGMVASQETTRFLLRQMDPVSVISRQRHRLKRRTYTSQGPNHIWHVDGYDKLRPYGFLISGCIDGFSRRIMWLKCAFTNHNPKVIADYYLECVGKFGGFPKCVRTDCGTENVTIASIQEHVLPRCHSHMYGSSPGNQRIEAWWSFYRRSRSQWWIEIFEDLMSANAFHVGHVRETELLRFCFMKAIRKGLLEVQASWNMHRIRPSKGSRCPAGIPDELYFLTPAGYRDCLLLRPLNTLPEFIHE